MSQRPVTRTHAYKASLTWTGAEQGPTSAYAAYSRRYRVEFEGKPHLDGSADPAFRGDPSLYNPEELLVAALSSCHLLTYLALCSLNGIEVVSYTDDASGTMQETGGAGRFARVILRPHVTIAGGDLERAQALHDDAQAQCFIAASVNFPVEHRPEVARA